MSGKSGRPGPRRGRTASRVAAVQALFQSEQAGISAETVIDEFVRHRLGVLPGSGGFEDGRVPEAEVPLFAGIVRAAVTQQETIDRMLAEALPAEWPLGRLDPVLRALLRAGGGGTGARGRAAGEGGDQRVSERGARVLRGRGTADGERDPGPAGTVAAAGGVRPRRRLNPGAPARPMHPPTSPACGRGRPAQRGG